MDRGTRYEPVDHQSRAQSVPRRVCDEVFRQMHQQLREYLDFHAIYPLIKTNHLIKVSEHHYHLTNPEITREQKIDLIISWLPKFKRSDYLTPFLGCLGETIPTVPNHAELVEAMEKLRDEELTKYKIVISMRSVYLVLSIFISMLTALYILGLILTLAILPSEAHGTEIAVFGSATIPLDTLMVDRWWLRSVDIAFDVDEACIGQAAVVESENCSTLPAVWEYADTRPPARNLVCHIYALPGSFLTVSLPNNTNTRTEQPHIWVTHTEEAYWKLNKQITPKHSEQVYRCNEIYPDATCYFAEEHVGSSVRFEVEHPGYYCVILTNGNDTSISPSFGIQWQFNYTSYNFTAIKSLYSVVDTWKYIKGKTETPVIVSRPFNFTRMNCAVLRLRCTDTEEHQFTVGHLVKRWDVAVVMTIAYVVVLCVLVIPMVVMWICCRVHNRRRIARESSSLHIQES